MTYVICIIVVMVRTASHVDYCENIHAYVNKSVWNALHKGIFFTVILQPKYYENSHVL